MVLAHAFDKHFTPINPYQLDKSVHQQLAGMTWALRGSEGARPLVVSSFLTRLRRNLRRHAKAIAEARF